MVSRYNYYMKRNCKKSILALRKNGNTIAEIQKELGCSMSTIAYHLYPKTRETTKARTTKIRKQPGYTRKDNQGARNALTVKASQFHRLGHRKNKQQLVRSFTTEELLSRLGAQPCCYLTGNMIDLTNPASYSLDHVVPVSRGGTSTIDNLGLTTSEANRAKNDRTVEEFLVLCATVLKHNGYSVEKK